MEVKIITDSTVDLREELKKQLKIVPLTVHFGEEEYIDGVTMTQRQFYEKLEKSDALPSTSQATPDAFMQVFEQIKQAGQSAVVLTLSSKLSGTYQSAMIAAVEYENIYVVDTDSVAIGSGILAELALQLADAGMDAKAIARRLEEEKKNVRIIAMVDTLEYLKRGGRVSKTVAFAGGLLNIKPVLSVAEGQIQILGKARGIKQGSKMLLEQIEETGGVDFSKPVMLAYTGLEDAHLKKFMEENEAFREMPYGLIGSVIGTHAGPGAVAIAFFICG